MARLSSVLFDIFFWVAAFCLSPLILCYFILAGLRSCLISILRLWRCPESTSITKPFDPDVESAAGNWPEEKKYGSKVEKEAKFETPTVEQVLEVKEMFANLRFTKLWVRDDKGMIVAVTGSSPETPPRPHPEKPIQVPPEVCDMILDLAGYWPCTRTVVSRLMLVGKQHPDTSTSVWMDKERDWRGNTPGASKRSQPWRRTTSIALGRALEDPAPDDGAQVISNGVYLRSFPLGGDMELVVPETAKAAAVKRIPKLPPTSHQKNDDDANSRWQRLTNMLHNGPWKSPIGVVVELEKRNAEPSTTGDTVLTSIGNGISSGKTLIKSYTVRQLYPTETSSWALEIDELYPNVRPGLDDKKFEKKENKRTKQQWRSFYTMSRFHQWVVPIYQYYSTTREEKFHVETAVHGTPEIPFEHKNILEPRLVDLTLSQNSGRSKKSAKVRKIIWTIWSKEMVDRTVNDHRMHLHLNPDSAPDLTWFEMFVEEPVPKSPADPEIVWKRKYPKGKENILVQRDLGHRIRVGESKVRIHRTVWDWNDWEETEPDDENELNEGNWQYQGIDPDLHNAVPSPNHPFRHLNSRNYCNCPFGSKMCWGDGVSPSKIAPVSSRLKPDEETLSKLSSGSSSSSSSGSSSSSSTASSSSSSSSDSSSTNSSSNSLPAPTKASSTYIAPNTVLEERIKTGSLRKNGALGKLVRSLRMGDRLVLVARAGGGLGWNPVGYRWDVGVYRAEVEVYWAV
ncbi:hypothetical protein BGX38DRAFT_1200755 [Terfezia claveryi]|nr:hypothetical protein BGX38DRAFT_1200755 [Terfezia claveryi]